VPRVKWRNMNRRRQEKMKHRTTSVEATLVPCHTPGKIKFRSRADAKKALRLHKHHVDVDAHGNKPAPYHCPCGAWHLGHPPGGRRIHPSAR
jgi:hypothetical protein